MKILLSFVVLLLIAPAMAQAAKLSSGAAIPSLSMENQDGKIMSFQNVKGSKGAVLIFYRSAGWCPYCQAQLIDFNKQNKAFNDKGFNLVGISYDMTNVLKKFHSEKNIQFPLLSDPRSDVIEDFGLKNEEYAKGTLAYGTPHPAIYVVDDKGKVLKVLSKAGYKDRPSVQSVLDALPKPAPVYTGEEFPEDPNADQGAIEFIDEDSAAEAIDDGLAEIDEAIPDEVKDPTNILPNAEIKPFEAVDPALPDPDVPEMPGEIIDIPAEMKAPEMPVMEEPLLEPAPADIAPEAGTPATVSEPQVNLIQPRNVRSDGNAALAGMEIIADESSDSAIYE